MNPKIQVRSPLRIDLSGGTLDIWPLHLFVGEGCVVNMAIDIYSQVEIEPRQEKKDKRVEFICKDISLHQTYPCLSSALEDKGDPRLSWLQAPLKMFPPQGEEEGFTLKVFTQGPVSGAGLGGSSSLLISLLKALLQWQERPLPAPHQLVELAVNIETALLGSPAGSQDHYAALSGGISILHYRLNGVEQELLSPRSLPWDFSDLSFLVYSGKAHHSGTHNFEIISRACQNPNKGEGRDNGNSRDNDNGTLSLLKDLNHLSFSMAQDLREGKREDLARFFQEEYDLRTRLSPSFESKEIKILRQWVLKDGAAQAIKVCGAGGGGCVFVWCDSPEQKAQAERICRERGYECLPFHPVECFKTSTSGF